MSEEYKNEQRCPVINALNMIGGKWKIPILWNLYHSDLRYNELKRKLDGITNIVLTRCLRDLEAAGLVNRVQYSEIPPHVVYSLTSYSRKLGYVLAGLNEWGGQIQAIKHSTIEIPISGKGYESVKEVTK